MRIVFRKAIPVLILVGIIITPLLSFQEVLSFIQGFLASQTEVLTSIYIKSLKDILLFSLLILGSVGQLFYRKKMNNIGVMILFLLISFIVLSLLCSINNSALTHLAGFRWALPLFLPFFIYPFIDEVTIRKLGKLLNVLFVIHIGLQLMQLFFAGSWFGYNALGLSSRNPGFFLIPSTGGFFTICVFYVNTYLIRQTVRVRFYLIFWTFISAVLTGSGTALVVWTILFLILVMNKGLISLAPLFIVCLTPFYLIIFDVLLSRPTNYIEKSGGDRINIFVNTFIDSGWISTSFGKGTNTAVLLGNGRILDSMYTSILFNLGLVAFIIFCLLITWMGIQAIIRKSKTQIGFVLLIALFSATVIITEAYPMNLILVVIGAIYLKNGDLYKIERKKSKSFYENKTRVQNE
jgi:hypothetical protein